mmetsp:Transcript_151630/g.368257  ORF Transcript_151630/g.368257 Transcript_151630/m.368257 type:complete len:206 (-) Transcript_151630:437-1054(-)
MGEEALAERNDALLRTNDGTLDHEEILIDLTVVREPAERCDSLLSEILFGHARALISLGADHVHLLVELSAVVVAVLPSARDTEGHTARVPRANARNLPQATVRLPHQARHAPARDDALDAVALADADDVDHLVLGEDVGDLHLLLEEAHAEVDLLLRGAAVHLDLLDVGLLRPNCVLADLCMADGSDHLAVLLSASDLRRHGSL